MYVEDEICPSKSPLLTVSGIAKFTGMMTELLEGADEETHDVMAFVADGLNAELARKRAGDRAAFAAALFENYYKPKNYSLNAASEMIHDDAKDIVKNDRGFNVEPYRSTRIIVAMNGGSAPSAETIRKDIRPR